MAVCPVCQSEIEIISQHHGTLFTCPSCSGVFFIDWSGQPEVQVSPSPHFETPTTSEPELPIMEEAVTLEEAPSVEEAPSDYDFSQPLDVSEVAESSGFSEIADFGNADLTQAAFNYSLTISGIDSGTLRSQVQEALSDSKFGWNVVELMAQIKGGVLTIRSMNAVKASILMQRVKYLPVKVSWRQDVLSNTV